MGINWEKGVNERDIAKYAALVATGVMVEDELSEMFGESVVADIMAFTGASVITGAVGGIVNDTVDEVFDIVDDLNPFW